MKFFKQCKNAAISLIVIGCIIFFGALVGGTKYEEYGGDAYTGIQNAAADTANNIFKACGILVAALGVVLQNYCNIKAFEYEENQKKHKELLKALGVETLETTEPIETLPHIELDFIEYIEVDKCEICGKLDTEKKYRLKNDDGVRDIPICRTCYSKLNKELKK